MRTDEFSSLKYYQRQIIGFIDDVDYESAQKKVNKEECDSNSNSGILARILNGVSLETLFKSASTARLVFANPVTLSLVAGAGLTIAASQLYAKYKKASENGIDVLLLPMSLAKNIRLPIGHPRKGVVYAGHPSIPECYFPYADFHRALFEHKSCELISLLMSLGAKTITVHHEKGWSAKMSDNISIGIPSAELDNKIEAEKSRTSKEKILYNAKFKGCDNPQIPANLIWFEHEPTWKQVADGRIKYGSESFSLNLTYNEDYGINGQLKAKLVKSGLEIGGDFQEHSSTIWVIEGSFI